VLVEPVVVPTDPETDPVVEVEPVVEEPEVSEPVVPTVPVETVVADPDPEG
jgi:hypothetical protein